MKLIFCFIELLFLSLASNAQGFNLRYDFDENGDQDGLWDVELLPDGYMIFGGATDTNENSLGLWTMKIDLFGNKLSEHGFFIPGHFLYGGWANGTDIDSDGGYIMGGGILSQVGKGLLVKYDNAGDTLWTKIIGDENSGEIWAGKCALSCDDGGYLIGGTTSEPGYSCGFVVKTDEFGEEIWRQYYGTTTQTKLIASMAKDPNSNGYLLGCLSYESGSLMSQNGYIIKTDLLGNVMWEMAVADQGFDDELAHVICPYDDIYLIAGSSAISTSGSYSDEYLAVSAVTDEGELIYSRLYGEHQVETALTSIKHVGFSGFITCGYTVSGSDQVGVMLRLNEVGDSLWLRKYHWLEGNTCYLRDVLPTEDGGFIAAGDAYPDNASGVGFDGWIVKTDAFGCVVPGCHLGISDEHLPLEVSIFPNPVCDYTNIYIKTRDPGSIGALAITDMNGKIIHNKKIVGGDVNVVVDVSNWEDGLYLVTYVDEADHITHQKLMVQH